jgi:hypothetical protein
VTRVCYILRSCTKLANMRRSTFSVNIHDSALFVCDSRGTTVIPLSFLRRVHRLFQREVSRECELVRPLSIYSILSFLKVIQQLLKFSSSPSLPLYPSITCFRRQFLRDISIQVAFLGVILGRYLHPAVVERLVSSSNRKS